jgi:hypothetical protein
MAELSEAFNCFNTINKEYHNIDFFFTQRNMKENHEYIDKNMNRKNRKVSIIYNFLAINIPINNEKNNFIIEIEIFGDSGYHYKGTISSYNNIIPSIMIPLKGDKKIFIHSEYRGQNSVEKENISENKHYMCFIDVPKRFQSIDDNILNLNDTEESNDITV